MPHLLRIPSALERFGLRPSLDPGWDQRGSASFSPRCVIAHHTGFDKDVTNILRNGHGTLPGPLCNVELRRNGHVHVIAAGRANHAGRGGFRGLSGNSSALGIEASSAGQSWTDAQLEAWPRVCAGLLWLVGRDETWLCGHREWTSRKWDPGALDLDWLRRTTAALLRGAPAPIPPPIQEEEEMIVPVDVPPNGEQVLWLEPTAPAGAGYLGVKGALIVLTTHRPTHEAKVYCQPLGGGPGLVTLRNDTPTVWELKETKPGRLHIRNLDSQWRLGGSVMYRR